MIKSIFFIHKSNSDYLKYVLNQARYSNPKVKIYLIGDESNNKYNFLTHANISDYFESSENFKKIYKHFSTNDYNYELLCFQRWFILKDFIKKNNIDGSFFYFDSDLMVYSDLQKDYDLLKKYKFSVCKTYGPQNTFFLNYSVLEEFCDFIEFMYKDSNFDREMNRIYKEMRDQDLPGGISDMYALWRFYEKNQENAVDLGEIIDDGVFDNKINEDYGFETACGIKKLQWIKKEPYCFYPPLGRKIKLKAVHFQGGYKSIIRANYKGKYNPDILLSETIFYLKKIKFYLGSIVKFLIKKRNLGEK
ncbi:MAG TPA: hypothetical protein PLO89_03260 [Spirochaetota bacterium]|nr:hypothetical protein [Spirochaetota bacterium]